MKTREVLVQHHGVLMSERSTAVNYRKSRQYKGEREMRVSCSGTRALLSTQGTAKVTKGCRGN